MEQVVELDSDVVHPRLRSAPPVTSQKKLNYGMQVTQGVVAPVPGKPDGLRQQPSSPDEL